MTSLELEPATFRPVAQCFNQLRYLLLRLRGSGLCSSLSVGKFHNSMDSLMCCKSSSQKDL
jgi:hypothetical protein